MGNCWFWCLIQFFDIGWILPNFNSSTIILIPKNKDDDSLNHYQPIDLSNFKFKINTKAIAERLAAIIPSLISAEQRGFIKGRNIRDSIYLRLKLSISFTQRTSVVTLRWRLTLQKRLTLWVGLSLSNSWPSLVSTLFSAIGLTTFSIWLVFLLLPTGLSMVSSSVREALVKTTPFPPCFSIWRRMRSTVVSPTWSLRGA